MTRRSVARPGSAGPGAIDAQQPAPTADGDGRHVERMARSGGLSLVGAGFSALAGVALTAVITNGFDQSTAGTIFATTSLFLIVTAVAQLGTEVGLVRSLPVLTAHGQHQHLRPVLRVAVLPVLGVSVMISIAALLLARPIARLISPATDPQLVSTQIRVLALFLPVAAVYNILLAATRGLRTMVPTVAVDGLGRSLAQLVMVGAVQLAGLGAAAALLAWSVPYALGFAVVIVWLTTLVHRSGRPDAADHALPADPAGRRASMLDFWRFTAPRAIGTASQMALKRADIVLVAALRTPREAALYAAASRFVVVGQLAVQALQQALSPQLSGLFARDDHAAAREVYRATTAWSMLLAWPIYLTCAALAPELLRLFGPGYSEVAPVVVVLCLAMLAATACGAVDVVLLMSGHAWLSLGNNVSALVLNLALNAVLIPAFGALGAGVAWTVSMVVRNLLPLAQISLKYRIWPVGRETVLVAVSAAVCFGALPLVTRILVTSPTWTLASIAVGAVLYVAALWRLRRDLRLHAFGDLLRARRRRGAAPASL